MASPAAKPNDRAELGPVADRDRDRGDEPEVGHDAGDAQVRQERRLQDDEQDEQQPEARRRGSRRPAIRGRARTPCVPDVGEQLAR